LSVHASKGLKKEKMKMDKPIEINDANFKEEVLDSTMPVLVDFWAPWCMPCTMTAPILEEIAKNFKNKIKVAKVNVDNNQQVASGYKITGIPSLLFFKDGEVVDKIIGLVPKEEIEKMANQIIKN